MILDTEETEARLSSPDNLLNKLRLATSSAKQTRKDFTELYHINSDQAKSPVLPPSVEDLIEDAEDKIKLTMAQRGSLDVINQSIELLSRNLCNSDPTKPHLISRVAAEMSKVTKDLYERQHGSEKQSNTQVIIYRPVMMNENHYESVLARE